ncbi:hypothetical protein ACLKMY_24155 [Paraburkholderia mimosarum]|uniref:hypothetical protein n=1 Tax=Paraburkholderia mimosarum TaxID=312026 RepID=UPI0039C04C88
MLKKVPTQAVAPQALAQLSKADVHRKQKCRTRLPGELHAEGTYAFIGLKRPASDVWASSIPLARREFLQRQRRQIRL